LNLAKIIVAQQSRFVGKCIVFADKVKKPNYSKITNKFLAENKDTIRMEYFPVG
jgi:hypothetical protein